MERSGEGMAGNFLVHLIIIEKRGGRGVHPDRIHGLYRETCFSGEIKR